MRRRFETAVHLSAPPAVVFAHLDNHARLAAHMEKPSSMMGGGRMTYDFDSGRGRAVGSRTKMRGSAFGQDLYVDEVVTEREPPQRKAWRTVGDSRLLVVGAYEMGFEITPAAEGSELRVWITYDLASGLLARVLGPSLAPVYAKWCVRRMASDAADFFGKAGDAPRETGARPPAAPRP